VIAMLAELPDLWDVNISGWNNDSITSRFGKEGHQEPYISFVKQLTTKPVVGVGRYTSPESMVSAIQRGVMDLIGAARPSIADPFLPTKIKEGRVKDIRECIGCNICVTGDTRFVPIRCTQNPTMGEEWRRGWHPEIIAPKKSDKEVMIIGAGPAGLEAARALGQRGYKVTLLEAHRELGGRVLRESALPGLNEWRRVIDWRLTQLRKMKNVALYPSSPMTTEEILESGAQNIILATGAMWRRDGVGRTLWRPIIGHDLQNVFSPDDLLDTALESRSLILNTQQQNRQQVVGLQNVVIYDDDHYYMGGVLAELLASNGYNVSLVTPAPMISYWSQFTLEQERTQSKLMKLGMKLYPQTVLSEIEKDCVRLSNTISGEAIELPRDGVVLVSDRTPNDSLYQSLKPALGEGKINSLRIIGDAEAPNIIAQAVFAGHLVAREFDEEEIDGTPFKIERIKI
jgi:dimethylamine/trimethylamine dehydrogenase